MKDTVDITTVNNGAVGAHPINIHILRDVQVACGRVVVGARKTQRISVCAEHNGVETSEGVGFLDSGA